MTIRTPMSRNTPMTIRTQPRRAIELIALMRYMVGHNVSHTNELKELAHKLAHTGDSEACAQILDAVQDYETGNQKLAASLDQLQK